MILSLFYPWHISILVFQTLPYLHTWHVAFMCYICVPVPCRIHSPSLYSSNGDENIFPPAFLWPMQLPQLLSFTLKEEKCMTHLCENCYHLFLPNQNLNQLCECARVWTHACVPQHHLFQESLWILLKLDRVYILSPFSVSICRHMHAPTTEITSQCWKRSDSLLFLLGLDIDG